MEKDLLNSLKNKIEKLSEEEKKKRNKYLWDIANNNILGPQVGYSSIDKQWYKYYEKEDLDLIIPKMSINEYMDTLTKDYDDMIAFEFFGKKITYKEFKNKRDEMAKSLLAMGVKKGDIVSVCLPNIPEVGYIFYAINKIGAVANMLDPRTNVSTLTLNVNDAKSDIIFTLDSVTNKFLDTNVKTIIPISAISSLPKFIQQIVKKKDKSLDIKIPKHDKILSFENFKKQGEKIKCGIESVYVENSPAVIAYTGGTTGVPKGVICTNEAFNSMIIENTLGGYNVSEKDKCINIAPPWTYYGLSNCFNAYLCIGVTSILIPALGPDDLGKLIAKHKPNHVITVPSALMAVMNEPKLQKKNLEYLKTIIVGADKLDPTFEENFNKFLENHSSNTKVTKGYGMTEVCAASTYTKGETNTSGTVGIPYILENVSIFDSNDYSTECMIGEQGEIAIKGPKNMMGYFGENLDQTKYVLKKHTDGTVWVHTGDIGHMDENGKLYVDGRLKRMFVRNGFKIFPGEIETQILKNESIKQAAVIAMENESTGFATKAYIVLKENINYDVQEILNKLNDDLLNSLYDYEIPDEIEIIDKLPLTGMNKINYDSLIELNNKTKKLIK